MFVPPNRKCIFTKEILNVESLEPKSILNFLCPVKCEV